MTTVYILVGIAIALQIFLCVMVAMEPKTITVEVYQTGDKAEDLTFVSDDKRVRVVWHDKRERR